MTYHILCDRTAWALRREGLLDGGEARGVGQGILGFWLDIFTERRPVKVLSTFLYAEMRPLIICIL